MTTRLAPKPPAPFVFEPVNFDPFVDTASETGPVPLSEAQGEIWTAVQMGPEASCAYNLCFALRLVGAISIEDLRSSIQCLFDRHEALRLIFEASGEWQRVMPSRAVDIPVVDLSSLPSANRRATRDAIFIEEVETPLDLVSGHPARVRIVVEAQNQCLLVFTAHHIVFDGWSGEIFFRELAEVYSSARLRGTASLPPVEPFSRFVLRDRQAERSEVAQAYWLKQFGGPVPVLDLPVDCPRPPVKQYRGAREAITLDAALSAGIRGAAVRQGNTLVGFLLAVFYALLHRLTGQDDIVVGLPASVRDPACREMLVGHATNFLPIRVLINSHESLATHMRVVRTALLDAQDHQAMTLVTLLRRLNLKRDPSRNSIVSVTFNFERGRLPGTFVDAEASLFMIARRHLNFELEMNVRDTGREFTVECTYDPDLITADTMRRWLGHYATLVSAAVADPEAQLYRLPLLTDPEKHQLLNEWNDTQADYPANALIQQWFEQQVEKTPNAIALIFEDQRLTYRELNNRANQLAHYLRKLGVGPESLVGICVERSLAMLVGILGILKAGGAYVPLDPSYPKERLAFMLEDSRAAVLISQSSLIERLPAHNTTVLCLDRDWEEISTESQDNPLPLTAPDSLAYVIYTSGSTGTPKGVLIPHHNVVRLFRATDSWFHFSPDDVWTLFHSYAFDFSVWELWGALVHGGRLVIVPFEVSRSPREFYELLCREQVTVLNQTPSAFRQLVQAEESITDTSRLGLRLVIFGGEALDFQSLRPWFERHGDHRPRLINMYGITETTVHVTYRVIKEADLSAGASSLIGLPIPDLELYVLDAHRNLVPVGVPGELYVGGAGLARGYLNLGELTAERFVDHPFDDGEERRLYRSGDLVRRRADGDIEYLGRIDNQVKIRGHRIELGEIESILSQHPAIQQAVVLAREDSPGDHRLVAYAVAHAGANPSAQALRSFLQLKLPDYMVPSAFVFLDSLPVTPNGKLDRKALPTPDQTRPELEETYTAPRTPTEETLAKDWAEVLKIAKVGVNDNFFDLGGHSLLATQLISRVNTSFHIDLPLRRLFESPTIASFADSIQTSRGIEKDSRSLQPIVPVPHSDETPLSFAQERLWFLDRLDPDSATYNVSAAFRLSGDLNVNALEQSLNQVVRRHQSLRTVFVTINGNPVQKILPSLIFSLTPIDLSEHPESEREKTLQCLLSEETELPFDLSRGPLIRAALWRLAPHDHVLALNMHHIVSDGWSMGVLFREVSALYRAYRSGQSNSLPELPIQYADYSVWQRDWLQGENLDIQFSYWRKQLDGLLTLKVPIDHPRPAVQTYRGSSQSVELSTQLSQALKGLSQREGVTLFMTLLAAFQTLLCRYCGQQDIVVGSPIAGRTRQETEGLIGFFVNTLVLRSDLSKNPTFKQLLRQIRETTLEAYTHQDLPFEKLVEELNPKRNPSISPLFQVMFIFQHNADIPLDFEHLAVDPIRTGSQVAKFDLSLTISERQGTLRASLNYNTDLFDATTIVRMLGHFQTLLEGIVANPDQPIGELPLLTAAEKHQLLIEWNDTKTEYPKDKCIHEIFEAQVEKSPDAIAVVFEDQQLTYRDLNHKANQLAYYLIGEGVQPETTVGIYLDRSIELAVALLAVLKAGGVYVPIDPSYPIERVKFILQDVQAPFVVTTQALASQFSLFSARTIILDTELSTLDCDGNANPRTVVGSLSPAYILFTSGSTGTPKGVVMSHRALNNLISWQVNNLRQGLPARTLQFAPLGFDVSIQEMFSTWCSGGSLYLIRNELRQDGSSLLKYIDKQSIARIFLPFVALQKLAEIAANEDCTPQSLREIVTAGEQLRLTKPLRVFLDRLKNCRLTNQYGPTESHVVTEYTLNRPFQLEPNLPPIGRPIANTQIYLLDPHLNPVPIGVTGEIYIGGDGVALGYCNRAELTQEKFLANPFSNDPKSRVYKTGDLSRYLPDGNIEFLGRIDNQVKIRGYRIELGEIEAVLAQYPDIQQAVVLAREDTPGDKRLVAYVVTANGLAILHHDLRSYLQHKLPDYMLPSAFVFLNTLPFTFHGKLDHHALPAPDDSRPELDDAFAAPTTPLEEILANIWADVLKLNQVGIHDNFFDLGGHSLLAAQVVSRIREALLADLPLRVLFEKPTVASLSDYVEAVRWVEKDRSQTHGSNLGETEDILL